MALIAIGGDAATTTSLALAAGWPDRAADAAADLVVIEADPSGGSLAAWLDTPLSPSLSTLVTSLHQSSGAGSSPASMWKTVDSMIRRSSAGVRFVPAPFRSREARGAIHEADHTLFGLFAASEHTIGLVDIGRIDPLRIPTTTRHADLVVVVHRQEIASAPAATVRLERLAETIDALRTTGHEVALAVIGDQPFPLDEIVEFAAPGLRAWTLAVDPLAAQVFAGRSGVSSKRLKRLPLLRSAARMAADIATGITGAGAGTPPARTTSTRSVASAPPASTPSIGTAREVAR